MKYLLASLCVAICLSAASSAVAQQKCRFQIDTAAILTNENLENFLTELKTGGFKVFNDKKRIPKFIKKELACRTDGFKIANPDEPYNEGCIIFENLPRRQLVFLASSENLFIMHYQQGGIGTFQHLLLIKFKDDKIIDLWKGNCSPDVKSVEDVVNYLERNRNREWGLNTNFVYF